MVVTFLYPKLEATFKRSNACENTSKFIIDSVYNQHYNPFCDLLPCVFYSLEHLLPTYIGIQMSIQFVECQ